MKRRNFLQTATAISAIPLCGGVLDRDEYSLKTPALSVEDQDSIARALGKKGTYNEAQATYTVPLPRNDLKVTVKGAAGVPESVPIPFGFGGWVSFKKTLDGKQTIMMSDTVLLEDEVDPLIDATDTRQPRQVSAGGRL